MTRAPERMVVVVSGRVQGVGFRWFVRREARALDLEGWVRNEPDGSVRIEAEGPRPALESLAGQVEKGPSGSRVDAVEVRWSHPTGAYRTFEIR